MTARVYGIMELAQLYFPNILPKSAARKLSNWIAVNPILHAEIPVGKRTLTPKQVKMVIEQLGEPC